MTRHTALFGAGVVVGLGLLGLSVGAALETRAEKTLQSGEATGRSTFTGTVRTADGKPLEGVTVSARAVGKTVTTTVFTDEQGEYFFPTLERAPYRVWAQAVGYEMARADATLDGSLTRRAFTLNTINDFTQQLSGSEWVAALPEHTKEQRRMKEIFRSNCSFCHSTSVVLRNRFDEQGWLAIINLMMWLNPLERTGQNRYSTIDFHSAELARYLATVRGPESAPLNFKVLPRPKGDAARVVITSYDIPIANQPDGLAWFDGSNWTEGPSTAGVRGGEMHDVAIDNNGNAWLTRGGPAEWTISKLDVQTAQVTGFRVLAPNGVTRRLSHGIARDSKGILWFDTDGALGRIDPATETFQVFEPPPLMGRVLLHTDADAHDKIWSSTSYGALRFDPDTKKWSIFQNPTPSDGVTYGSSGDADGNGWWCRHTMDRVGKGDVKSGKTYEVLMQPPWTKDQEDLMTAADREFYESIGVRTWGKVVGAPNSQAPRRMGSDKNGDTVWVPNFFGNNIAKINIHTLKTQYYRLPVEGYPYSVEVDRHHNVWMSLLSDDRTLKFNPRTEQWTVYQLPSNGCQARRIAIDDMRDEVWVPCHQTGQVNRLQFRTVQELQVVRAAAKR